MLAAVVSATVDATAIGAMAGALLIALLDEWRARSRARKAEYERLQFRDHLKGEVSNTIREHVSSTSIGEAEDAYVDSKHTAGEPKFTDEERARILAERRKRED